jgi:uncharacterized membrane protein
VVAPAVSRRLVSGAAWLLSLVLLTTGTWHFVAPSGFESIVPGFLGWPAFWVAASGIAELICAVLLMVAATRSFAGWACLILFVVVFPANITMAVDSIHGDGSALLAWLRLPLQVPLILWALYIARGAAHLAGADVAQTSSAQAAADPVDGERH